MVFPPLLVEEVVELLPVVLLVVFPVVDGLPDVPVTFPVEPPS